MRVSDHVEALLKTRGELMDELANVNAMLAASGEKVPRVPRTPATAQAEKRRKNGNGARPKLGISTEKIEAVFNTVVGLDAPAPRAEIAEKVDNLSEQAVGKVLSHLARERRIRHAGFMPGVKGKRPLYAPWPTERENGAEDERPAVTRMEHAVEEALEAQNDEA